MRHHRPRHPGYLPTPLSYRFGVASRALAAILGGYALASTLQTLLALTLPLSQEEAIIAGAMVSFLVYPAAVLWVFTANTAWRAWLGLLVPGAVSGAAVWWLLHGVAG